MKTAVVFRVWNHKPDKGFNGDVIALFPYQKEYGGRVMSYERVGQHGGADYSGVIECSRAAKPEEFASLARELESIGYSLRILQRKGAEK
jgi:hypothetical protein